jgi:predicted Zn-dependent protease
VSEPHSIEVDYFDGRSARARRIRAHLSAGKLYLLGDGIARSLPLGEVSWPERTRRGARIAHLSDGGSLHTHDAPACDAWLDANGRGDSLVSRAQQSWRWVAAFVLVLMVLLAGVYHWGLPWMARGALSLVPESVERQLGDAALQSIGARLLRPSELAPEEQQRLRGAFEVALNKAYPEGRLPAHRVYFHESSIGPNAFALPGGAIVVTDELVKLVDGDAQVIVGVLAHELGHVEHRHGMRMLVQATALTVVSSVAFGDYSGWLSTAPVLLGQAGYSRDAEREADQASVRILKAAGISPRVMLRFFEKLAEKEGEGERSRLGIALASHPADEERMRFFRGAAKEP